MISFVSLFLTLVTGIQVVEVTVDPAVARVEILLDGRQIGEMVGEPWAVRCDFGDLLEPHNLVAVAFSADDTELGRTHQVLNIPKPEAEVVIVLDRSPNGEPKGFRIIAESAGREPPLGVVAVFNGRELGPGSEGYFRLPDYDPAVFNLISAEVNYDRGVSSRADLGFGGAQGMDIATELTAIPIRVAGDPPRAADLVGRFSIQGDPLRVAAIEHSGPVIYVVRDVDAFGTYRAAGRQFSRRYRAARGIWMPVFEFDLDPAIGCVRLVGTNASTKGDLRLYPISGPVSLKRWSLPFAATTLFEQRAKSEGQRIAEATAAAGFRAAGHGRPRAVVLVLSSDPVDSSLYSSQAVRHYLDDLSVPLYVWVADEVGETTWGPAVTTLRSRDISRASERLLDDLEDQWIVWVEGLHLVNQIQLDGDELGLELVGK